MFDSAIYTTPLNFSQFQPKLYRGTHPHDKNFPYLKLLQLKTIISILPEPITEENDPEFVKFIQVEKIKQVHIPCDGKKKKKKDKNKKDKDKGKAKDVDGQEAKEADGCAEKLKDAQKKDKSAPTSSGDPAESKLQDEAELAKQEEEKKVKRRDKAVPITEQSVYEIIDILLDNRNYPIYLHCATGETITPIVVACLRKLSYWSSVSIVDEFIRFSGSINVHERAFIEEFNVDDFTPKLTDKTHYASWIKRTQGWKTRS
ncbi:hypothetical protein ACO0QE_002858 [Hanseniaspora vineae]